MPRGKPTGAPGDPIRCTVSIEFSGSYQQLAPLLADLGRMLGAHDVRVVEQASTDEGWDEHRAARFVAELKTPALIALRLIAAGAPKIGVAEVQAQMAEAGIPTTPGTLSSIGFAMRRLGFPPPFTRDGYQRAYLMDPDAAEKILAAIGHELQRRDTTVSRPAPARRPRSGSARSRAR